VFVIDDDASVRRAIRRLVESVGLRVEAMGSAKEFLRTPSPDVPSCIILDVRLPEMSGLELQSELAANGTPIPVIFITAYGDIPMTVRAMRSGAIEFLPKPFRDQDLLDAVQMALEKDRLRRRRDAEMSVLRDRFRSLTNREREILPMVVSGLLNKQIAALIEASEATVKVHRSQLTKKMEARSLPDLVRMAEKIGIPSTNPRGT
jgi:FixJ family two-component response regulator